MHKIKKIIVEKDYLFTSSSDDAEGINIVNAENASDIDSFRFDRSNSVPSAKSLKLLKSYVDTAIIPEGALTFDNIPTLGSNNPVTSQGIYNFVLAAIETFFREKFVVLTEAEYEELEEKDENVFYMIEESEIVEEEEEEENDT